MFKPMIGIPSKRKISKKPRVLWLFPIVLVAALVLGGVQFAQERWGSPEVPTADIPAVTYDELKSNQGAAPLPADADEQTPIAPIDDSDNDVATSPAPTPTPTEPPTEEPTQPAGELNASFNLAVPFTSQAPFGVWDAVHEDTCEEAAIYMVTQYYEGVTGRLDPTTTDEVLVNMVNRQTELGMGYSISAAQLVSFVDDYYDGAYSAVIVNNPTADDLKRTLADGHPIIVPAAGRELGNPFFTGEGPLYHMYVIRGYDETTFITNDPGTRQGENYSYSTNVVMNAIADWNGSGLSRSPQPVVILTPAL